MTNEEYPDPYPAHWRAGTRQTIITVEEVKRRWGGRHHVNLGGVDTYAIIDDGEGSWVPLFNARAELTGYMLATPLVWPERVQLRDTGLEDEGTGARIYTTAGSGYTRREYIRASLLTNAVEELDAVLETLGQHPHPGVSSEGCWMCKGVLALRAVARSLKNAN